MGNVRQDPHSAYTISGGTTLAFTAAPPTGTNNIYVVYQGKSIGETTPGENSIEFGMIKSINGGYENKASISSNITVASGDNMMIAGPASFTGTVTVNGTLTGSIMGTLFVDNIKQQSSQGSGTITIGASGETVALGSGVTPSGNLEI